LREITLAQLTYRTSRVDDAMVIDTLTTAVANVPTSNPWTVVLQVVDGLTPLQLSLADFSRHDILKAARDGHTSFWKKISLRAKSAQGAISVDVTREDFSDLVQINVPDSYDPAHVMAFGRSVSEGLPPFSSTTALTKALGPELTQFYERREQGLLKLESISQQLIHETHDYRLQLDAEAKERQKLDSEAIASRTAELESTYSRRAEELIEREKQLASDKAQFDDRSARHVRRDSVKGLKSIIKGRADHFALTAETRKKRWPIHAIFLALLTMSAAVVYWGFAILPSDNEQGPQLWLHLVRVPTGVIGFALASVYYIRWNDQWFRQHSDEEFRLRQLELDVDRASWVTELALELRDEKGDLPAALLDRLSAALFVSRPSEAVRHPSQDLLSTIIGASSHLKLRLPGGIEADMGRSGIKKVQDELKKASE
jgi:hypothetical protein